MIVREREAGSAHEEAKEVEKKQMRKRRSQG
jgi:hypothetical protein